MPRWTQPGEVREYARVSHQFMDAFLGADRLRVVVRMRDGEELMGRLVSFNSRQDPDRYLFSGHFTIRVGAEERDIDMLDVIEVRAFQPPASPLAKEGSGG